MTYILTTTSGGDPDTFRAIVARVEPHAHGLIARYAGRTDDGLAITTVWESKAHSDRFTIEHLMPAVKELTGQSPGGPGVMIEFEAFDEYRADRP